MTTGTHARRRARSVSFSAVPRRARPPLFRPAGHRPRLKGTTAGAFTLIELLVVISIVMILAGMLTTTVLGSRARVRQKAIGIDISTFVMGLSSYRKDFKEYPPDTIPGNASDTPEQSMNEALVYWLARKHRRGLNYYGPFVELKKARLVDEDNDGFMEYKDPFDNYYLYAENESQTVRNENEGLDEPGVGHQQRSYDLVSAGKDGVLGGIISTADGFVENKAVDSNGDGVPDCKDDVYNWSLER